MFFKPDIIALFVGSLLISGLLLYCAFFCVQILKNWDLHSGSERQLGLERRTYLISTMVAYAFAFQLFSLFLFIFAADRLHPFFTGAMCAAGSLNVNGYGYPVVILKAVNCLLAGLWLIINYTDNQGFDYPLIRVKYTFLLAITPMILIETIIQGKYFLGLQPEIITSCCGALFTSEGKGIASEVVALPRRPLEIAFGMCLAATFVGGIRFYRMGKGGLFFSLASLLAFVIALASLISFISVYIYELPMHHCPFCILQGEYNYVGYPIYLTLIVGVIGGMGVGALMPFKKVTSLKQVIPAIQKKLTVLSLVFFSIFIIIVTLKMVLSNLRM